jgi:hypothetical protein
MKHTAARTRPAVLRATTPPKSGAGAALRGTKPHHVAAPAGARAHRAGARLATRVREVLADTARRPDRGDISITTVIIWVAAVAGALLIAGTIAVVISKYNVKLGGI